MICSYKPALICFNPELEGLQISSAFKSIGKMSHDHHIQLHPDTQKEAAVSTDTGEGLENDLKPAVLSEVNAILKTTTWSPEEEKRLLRRLDFYLIPLVMIMFFTLNLDR